jgi:hypothetical protein
MCLKQLKMVFREDGDIQQRRMLPTPPPDKMLVKLDNFVSYWSSQNETLLRPTFLQEVRKLKRHISRGCLSNIPPGAGTNRNEALHRYINPFFHSTRMSVQYAVAILTFLFFCHNASIAKKSEEITPNTLCSPYFAQVALAKRNFQGQKDVYKHDHTYAATENFGIIKDFTGCKRFWGSFNLSSPEEVHESLSTGADENELFDSLNVMDIKSILTKAVYLTDLTRSLQSLLTTPLFCIEHIPFMGTATNLFESSEQTGCNDDNMQNAAQSTLDSIISGIGAYRIPMEGDGNCCFNAFATAVKEIYEWSDEHDQSLKEHIESIFPEIKNTSNTELQWKLRKLAVDEWLENSQVYQCFLSEGSVAEEAPNYLQSGYFFGELGNTMVLAISNALKMSVIVVSAINRMPFIRVDSADPVTSRPLFVAFDQTGSGHYDGIKFHVAKAASDVPIRSACRCGANDKGNQKPRCAPSAVYGTRCPCFNQRKSCSWYCKCHNCVNHK